MSLDNCPTCDRRITDLDTSGIELETGQRWCLEHLYHNHARVDGVEFIWPVTMEEVERGCRR